MKNNFAAVKATSNLYLKSEHTIFCRSIKYITFEGVKATSTVWVRNSVGTFGCREYTDGKHKMLFCSKKKSKALTGNKALQMVLPR
jgi:hypothetical protein